MRVVQTAEGFRVEAEEGVFIMLLSREEYDILAEAKVKIMQSNYNKFVNNLVDKCNANLDI